jgi:hypothetical protein
MLGGDAYVEQLISTGLGDGESINPWNNPGLGEFMLFAVNAEGIEGEIRQRVKSIFASLERDQLARLGGGKAIKFVSKGGDKTMFVEYENMENGERREIEVPLPPAGG